MDQGSHFQLPSALSSITLFSAENQSDADPLRSYNVHDMYLPAPRCYGGSIFSFI